MSSFAVTALDAICDWLDDGSEPYLIFVPKLIVGLVIATPFAWWIMASEAVGWFWDMMRGV